ncbi:hypothetical protein EDM52_18460 [Brevibacillus invocatus]|uniref:Uncharacterized protein n=1 Tax=Brevibacillus invocatus TaxID=173959 RepID=A0A3M8C2N1_9BACL|nr:hypothetical protein [Brevibacillus invocatus]RNB69952.1 hypothetical protein EDM52_18460 [Brevibacillus invocatus]
MIFLSDHMKETADIMAGYITGRLFVENGTVGIQRSNGQELYLGEGDHIEVRNGDEYQPVTTWDALTAKTVEGWPLYAGLYARVKQMEKETLTVVEVSDSVTKLIYGIYFSRELAEQAVAKSDKNWWSGEPVYKELKGVSCEI